MSTFYEITIHDFSIITQHSKETSNFYSRSVCLCAEHVHDPLMIKWCLMLARQTAHCTLKCLTMQCECNVTAFDKRYSKTKWMWKQRAALNIYIYVCVWNPFSKKYSLANRSVNWEDFKLGHSSECKISQHAATASGLDYWWGRVGRSRLVLYHRRGDYR